MNASVGREEGRSGTGSKRYRNYVLAMLFAAYALNYLDRMLIGVLNEPIRKAFALGDFHMGLLGGPAFAFLFALLGLPIARLSESVDRRTIIAVSIGIWSVMTALCGLAGQLPPAVHTAIFLLVLVPLVFMFWRANMRASMVLVLIAAGASIALLPILNGYGLLAFGLLLMTRVGVGIGEAGCAPPATSIIADYFPTDRRATAMSVFSLGIPLGGLLAAIIGSVLAQFYGWRTAFLVLGMPGIVVSLLIFLTVREPARSVQAKAPSLLDVVSLLLRSRTFRHVTAASALAAFAIYGSAQFGFAFLMRAHGLSLSQGAALFVLTGAVMGAVGIFLGGYLTDKLSRRIPGAAAIVPGVGLLLATPLLIAAYLVPSKGILIVMLAGAAVVQNMYIGPVTSTIQGLVQPRMRATAIAIFALVNVLVGAGLGPPFVGFLSDFLSHRAFAGDYDALCQVGGAACDAAKASGLRSALSIVTICFIWAGIHMFLAGRTIVRDTALAEGAVTAG